MVINRHTLLPKLDFAANFVRDDGLCTPREVKQRAPQKHVSLLLRMCTCLQGRSNRLSHIPDIIRCAHACLTWTNHMHLMSPKCLQSMTTAVPIQHETRRLLSCSRSGRWLATITQLLMA